MHAYLVTGSDVQHRSDYIQNQLQQLGVHPVDTVLCETESEHIGIADIRTFIKRLMYAPNQSPYVVGIIHNAHTMTVEAQSALLKTLEEPPPNAMVFLDSPSAEDMLNTIISRCVTVVIASNTTKTNSEHTSDFLQTLTDASIGLRLTLLEPFTKDRITARLWLETTMTQIRQNMLTHIQKDSKKTVHEARLLTLLMEAYTDVASNINPKLAIETRLVSF